MKSMFEEFLCIAKKLNEQNIVPLLMGSLGLEYVTKIDWNAQDIDIHVPGDPRGWEAPDEERIYEWNLIRTIMEDLGYEMTDLHEHAFDNGKYEVEFGTMNTLPSFAKVELDELELIHLNDIKFYLPTADHFLKIYQSSYKDSYRADNNNHKDLKKINYLKQLVL